MDRLSDDQLRTALTLTQMKHFGESARSAQYLQTFCDRFAHLAPEQWQSLLALEGEVLPYLESSYDGDDRVREREKLWEVIRRWAAPSGIDSVSIVMSAFMTLVALALNKRQDGPLPESLISAAEVSVQEDENGKLWSVFEPAKVAPLAETAIYPPRGPLVWNRFRESPAAFRKRAVAEFEAWLRGEIDFAVRHNPVDPSGINYAWVDWFILSRVVGTPTNSIARQYKVGRNAVDEGVHAVALTLGCPDHHSTPARFRSASGTDKPR